ncbi:hypothetical protein LA080_001936 [Diaporthe eres]|nr:hypothetical protein LA080_001936 [Diaporthe eres]
MASSMRFCEDCDRLQSYPQTCYKLLMEGYHGVFGHLIEPTVNSFSWNDDWEVNHKQKTVRLLKTTSEERRDAIDRLLSLERENGTFRVLKKWTGERLPIFRPNRELVADLECSASGLFGIVTYGVQLITYREDELMLDFFIRHGLVTSENELRYNEIISRLHRPLGTCAA